MDTILLEEMLVYFKCDILYIHCNIIIMQSCAKKSHLEEMTQISC